MLRWLTAGESHGRALVAVCEGVPAGVEVTTTDLAHALARRRAGYGRGARMKFEQDEVELTGGVRHGLTLGGPVAIRIGNTEWPKWETVMSADPVDPEILAAQARNAPADQAPARPRRPGRDAEIRSRRRQGRSWSGPARGRPRPGSRSARSPAGCCGRCWAPRSSATSWRSARPRARGLRARAGRTPRESTRTRCAAWTRRPAPPCRPRSMPRTATVTPSAASSRSSPTGCRLASAATCTGTAGWTAGWPGALMSIQAIKGVEVGDGFTTAMRRGSQAHDEIDGSGRSASGGPPTGPAASRAA